MVVPEDQDGKSGHATNLIRDLSSPATASAASSRKAGGREEAMKPTVKILLDIVLLSSLKQICNMD